MMMGSETELGILDGWRLERAEAIQGEVLKRHCHLPAVKVGVFLGNGARVYVDQGKQNEYSTPEASSPSELVACELAGRRLMAECAQAAGLSLLCSNVDPQTGATWGTHENYECSCSARELASERLYPHLVTRIIYTGAGGIEPAHRGASLVLSPRASQIRSSYSCQGVPCKTLVFAKPESYCEGFRLHVFCGESLLCHSASYLKYAATALVARCLALGLKVGPGRLGVAPVRALRSLNRDVSLSIALPLADGRRMTALEIQACYLEDVARYRERLPEWAPLALKRWREMLDALEGGDEACARRVDWLVYGRLFGELAEDFGLDSDRLRDLNARVSSGQLVPEAGRLWELRAAANALYVKLHVLGSRSLFDEWCSQSKENGASHRLPEVGEDHIARAVSEPPPGRAENRAALVRKYASREGCTVSWNSIVDRLNEKRLEIPQDAGWREPAGWQDASQSTDTKCFLSAGLFRRGSYAEVIGLLEPVFTSGGRQEKLRTYSDLCLSYARIGQKDRAVAALAGEGRSLFSNPLEQAAFTLFCVVNYGLCTPLKEMAPLIRAGEEAAAGGDAENSFDAGYDQFVFHQNRAAAAIVRGELSVAESVCRELLAVSQNARRPRMSARTRCYLSRALYLQGKLDEARKVVEEAARVHEGERMWGDRAVHSLPLQALLAESKEKAGELLARAEEICRRLKNPLGLAKILCIKARRLNTRADSEEIRRLCAEVPALRDCPVAGRVVAEWDAWVERPSKDMEPDDYWCVG